MKHGGSGYTTITQNSSFLTTQANRTGELVEILEIKTPAGKRFNYPANRGIEMFLMTHEQFTTDGTGGTDETFSLSNDLVNSPALADADTSQTSGGAEVNSSGQADLVLYDGGTQKAMVSVDYDANEFVYADAGTGSTLDVYYVWGDSSLVEGRYYAANEEEHDQVFGSTAGEMHSSKTFSGEEKLTFQNSFSAGPKERVKFMVNTQVDLTNWDASGSLSTGSGGGPNSTTSYSSFRIPVTIRDAPNRRNMRTNL